MNNKTLVTMGLIAAMLMTGCAGKAGTGTQTDAAQTEATAVEAQAETEAGAGQETAAAEFVKYESADGWSTSYDKNSIEVTEDDGTWFSYIGKADGVNRIIVKYYPGQMPDEVLYDVMADANGMPEHTRSEGYFGTGTDVWSMRTSMVSEVIENATEDYIAVERNGGTLLLQVITTGQADEMTGMSVSDALSAVIDSFELKDQQPQTYSANIPGKYTAQIADQIDGQEVTAEYFVQFNEDHTGVIHMQDEIPVIWYSREGKVLSAQTGEQIYEYVVEGDMLYLTDIADQNPETIEFTKEAEAQTSASVDYSSADNWVYFGVGDDKDVDLFLVCPTVDTLDEEFMSLENDVMKGYFAGALEMERGIYEESTRMYAPYYRQVAMNGYEQDLTERERRLAVAYKDVSDAFAYYLENENNGRPIILAGFSQGSDMVYRLMEEYFGSEEMQQKLVAAYAIGWACTEDMVKEYPQIRPAQSADDLGVVISFDCEAPEVSETIVNPAGRKAYSINPLNWKTDSTPADKSLNIGSRFMKSSGKIKSETEQLCGCYIDEERGALKVTDVTPAEYPAVISFLPEGAYHIYDYQFFFMNLQENVKHRVELYMEQAAASEQAA